MIGYLSGLIIDKDEKSLLVLTGGVGYKVFSTTECLSEAKIDQKVQLYIHTGVREDDISLFGFKSKEELRFYEQLLGVSGIGPKMAMEILGAPISLTKNAILSSDVAMLTKIKGLGKKTAERLCLELKNKVEMSMGKAGTVSASRIQEEAVQALESLGYERYQILRFMGQLPSELTETEDIVKYFLKSA